MTARPDNWDRRIVRTRALTPDEALRILKRQAKAEERSALLFAVVFWGGVIGVVLMLIALAITAFGRGG